jgi:hypothetical protein
MNRFDGTSKQDSLPRRAHEIRSCDPDRPGLEISMSAFPLTAVEFQALPRDPSEDRAMSDRTDKPRGGTDPFNLDHVRAQREHHRLEAHNGDREGFYDCAVCGVLNRRLKRLERAFRESHEATKQ